MNEIARTENCKTVAEIINLKGNSLIYTNISNGKVPADGKWKMPPE